MESQFGAKIRTLREKQNLFLRQVASLLEMDTAQLSKIEKGSRQLKREQIPVIAEILKADKEELLTLWLADQVMEVLKGEPLADKALKSVTKKRKQDNVN
jgi:transcriptional regulator with XRE-family HTH domain